MALYKPGDYPEASRPLLRLCSSGNTPAILICSLAAAFAWLREWRRQKNAIPYAVEARKKWKRDNRDRLLEQQREYNMRPDVARKRSDFYKNGRAINPDKYRKLNAESFQRRKSSIYSYRNRRAATVPQVKLASRIRTYLGNVLKKRVGAKAESFWSLVGCTPDELKAHLESQFKPGMSWDNWTKDGWHIDHVRPLASFDLTIKDQRLQACHFSNLKPEWADINHSKNSLYDGKLWRAKDHTSTSCTIPAPAVNCA